MLIFDLVMTYLKVLLDTFVSETVSGAAELSPPPRSQRFQHIPFEAFEGCEMFYMFVTVSESLQKERQLLSTMNLLYDCSPCSASSRLLLCAPGFCDRIHRFHHFISSDRNIAGGSRLSLGPRLR